MLLPRPDHSLRPMNGGENGRAPPGLWKRVWKAALAFFLLARSSFSPLPFMLFVVSVADDHRQSPLTASFHMLLHLCMWSNRHRPGPPHLFRLPLARLQSLLDP